MKSFSFNWEGSNTCALFLECCSQAGSPALCVASLVPSGPKSSQTCSTSVKSNLQPSDTPQQGARAENNRHPRSSFNNANITSQPRALHVIGGPPGLWACMVVFCSPHSCSSAAHPPQVAGGPPQRRLSRSTKSSTSSTMSNLSRWSSGVSVAKLGEALTSAPARELCIQPDMCIPCHIKLLIKLLLGHKEGASGCTHQ